MEEQKQVRLKADGTPDERGKNPEFTKGTWQKGQSGNPAGRPKGSKNKAAIVQALLESYVDTKKFPFLESWDYDPLPEKITLQEAFNMRVMMRGLKTGDPRIWKEIMDCAYGKTPDVLQVSEIADVHINMNQERIEPDEEM